MWLLLPFPASKTIDSTAAAHLFDKKPLRRVCLCHSLSILIFDFLVAQTITSCVFCYMYMNRCIGGLAFFYFLFMAWFFCYRNGVVLSFDAQEVGNERGMLHCRSSPFCRRCSYILCQHWPSASKNKSSEWFCQRTVKKEVRQTIEGEPPTNLQFSSTCHPHVFVD